MRNIPECPGYKISKSGKVDSYLDKQGNITTIPHTIKPQITRHGRKQVTLYLDNKPTRMLVSRLVAITYIPNPNNYPVVMHRDNNPLNNHVSNLKWGTYSENTQQAYKEGRMKGNIKVDKILRDRIYSLLSKGITRREISTQVGVSYSTVRRAIKL